MWRECAEPFPNIEFKNIKFHFNGASGASAYLAGVAEFIPPLDEGWLVQEGI